MKRYILRISLLSLVSSGLFAAPHVVEPAPFEKKLKLEGVLLPKKAKAIYLDPKEWSSFRILEVVPQGTKVKKGDAIVVVDTEELDQKIVEEKEAKVLRDLNLEVAKRELANLEVQTPRMLEESKRAYERAREDFAYFNTTGRAVREDLAKYSVERAERFLEYQQEELKQLLQMYREDDLTEETEEIILKRQRNSVEDSKNSLKRAQISTKRTLETSLPREKKDLEFKLKSAELSWNNKKESLPKALKKKNLETKKLVEAAALKDTALAGLIEDRAAMEIKAGRDGVIYYGEMKNGRWDGAAAAKVLKKGGSLPSTRTFATLVPSGSGLLLHASAKEEQLGGLTKGLKGYFSPKSAPRSRLPVEVVSVAAAPSVAGAYAVVFKVSGKGSDLVTGMSGTIRLVAYSQEDALTVPSKSLIEKEDGTWAVKVLSDKEDPEADVEERTVELGPEAEGQIVITSGLKAGEAIKTSEEKEEEKE